MEKEKIREDLINSVIECAQIYKDYITSWICNDFEYCMYNTLFGKAFGEKNQFNNPFIMFEVYIRELKLNNNTYRCNYEKRHFFDLLLNKVINDIKDILHKYGENGKNNILKNVYGCLAYNRYLGSLIVNKQDKNCLIISEDQDEFLGLLFSTMELSGDATREIEQYISTQEEALELLIKIINSTELKENDVDEFHIEDLKILFSLSHLLVLYINTKFDLTIGINKEKEIMVCKNGRIEVKEAFEWGNLSLKNYDYRFAGRYEEYNSNLIKMLKNNIFHKLGFDFDDVNKLEKYLISIMQRIIIVADKSEWLDVMIKIGMNVERAKKLIDYFTLETFKEEIIVNEFHRYINTNNYSLFSQKIFIEFDGTLICYVSQSIKAMEYFKHSVYNAPHKFVSKKKIVDKISESFCKFIENELKDSFKYSHSISNFHLSKVCNSNREIDVLFVIKNTIYIIECKRLSFSENNIGIQNEYAQLIGHDSFQLKSEIEDFEKNQEKIIEYLQSNNLIEFEKKNIYRLKGIIVIKEFSPAQLQSTRYPIIRADQLVEYLKEDMDYQISTL